MGHPPRYLVQVRRVGEPWLTVERHETEGAARLRVWVFMLRHDDLVRVTYRAREIFNPRRAA